MYIVLVFGLYAPANSRGIRGAPQVGTPRTADELAKAALGYNKADFLFSGSMEYGVDRGIGLFTDFVNAMTAAGSVEARWQRPISLKTPQIGEQEPIAFENLRSEAVKRGVAHVLLPLLQSPRFVRTGAERTRCRYGRTRIRSRPCSRSSRWPYSSNRQHRPDALHNGLRSAIRDMSLS